MPPERFLDRVAERRDRSASLAQRRRTWTVGGGVVASLAAAAALLLVLRPGPVTDGGDDVRFKGAGFSLVRQRGAEQHEMTSADRVRAGDALEVVVTQARAGAVAAWIVDGSGRIDAVVEGAVAHLGAGRGALPASLVVDAPCSPMVVVAAAGDAIAPTETAMRAVVAGAGGLPASGDWVPRGGWWRRVDCE